MSRQVVVADAVRALAVIAYSVVIGGAAGAIWQAHASMIALGVNGGETGAVNGSEGAFKALLDDDVQLALIGIGAGLLAVALLLIVSRGRLSGRPGVAVGLAVGGLLGSLVAAHVGAHAQHGAVAATLRHNFPGITSESVSDLVSDFGFRVRMHAVLFAWPLVALLAYGAALAAAPRRDR